MMPVHLRKNLIISVKTVLAAVSSWNTGNLHSPIAPVPPRTVRGKENQDFLSGSIQLYRFGSNMPSYFLASMCT